MKDSWGQQIESFGISIRESWPLIKYCAIYCFIPSAIVLVYNLGLVDGLLKSTVITLSASFAAPVGLLPVLYLLSRVKLYTNGIVAFDSSLKTGHFMKWSDIQSISANSVFVFKVIEISDSNENKVYIFKNLTNKAYFIRSIHEIAGSTNPLSVYLTQNPQ